MATNSKMLNSLADRVDQEVKPKIVCKRPAVWGAQAAISRTFLPIA